jgi:2-keto-4-pentenoate hydratase/2-oxohepta-3-ene-1,7-dioic acid hydratase in catechol pathway
MKLLRYGPPGAERPGLLDADGVIRDLSGQVPDIRAEVLSPEGLEALRRLDPASLPAVPGKPRLGPPVSGVGKMFGIGWNYPEHCAETGTPPPREPLVFSKAVTSLAGPADTLVLPKGSTHTDHEVELALVIGRRALYVEEKDALDHVAGYAVMNDVSEREYQKMRGGDFLKGKSFDGFGPMGPWLVTADEIPDPQALDLWLDVNGERRQTGNTANMAFGVAFLVSYLSRFLTLMPGDVVTTGTPPGVGWGRDPKVFLKHGDVVTLGVAGLGSQRIPVVAWPGDRR